MSRPTTVINVDDSASASADVEHWFNEGDSLTTMSSAFRKGVRKRINRFIGAPEDENDLGVEGEGDNSVNANGTANNQADLEAQERRRRRRERKRRAEEEAAFWWWVWVIFGCTFFIILILLLVFAFWSPHHGYGHGRGHHSSGGGHHHNDCDDHCECYGGGYYYSYFFTNANNAGGWFDDGGSGSSNADGDLAAQSKCGAGHHSVGARCFVNHPFPNAVDPTLITDTNANSAEGASPCEDFASYACGNWLTDAPLLEDRAFQPTTERVSSLLRQVLKIESFRTWGHGALSTFFSACTSIPPVTSAIDNEEQPLRHMYLEMIRTIETKEDVARVAAELAKIWIYPFFEIQLIVDPRNPGHSMIQYEQPEPVYLDRLRPYLEPDQIMVVDQIYNWIITEIDAVRSSADRQTDAFSLKLSDMLGNGEDADADATASSKPHPKNDVHQKPKSSTQGEHKHAQRRRRRGDKEQETDDNDRRNNNDFYSYLVDPDGFQSEIMSFEELHAIFENAATPGTVTGNMGNSHNDENENENENGDGDGDGDDSGEIKAFPLHTFHETYWKDAVTGSEQVAKAAKHWLVPVDYIKAVARVLAAADVEDLKTWIQLTFDSATLIHRPGEFGPFNQGNIAVADVMSVHGIVKQHSRSPLHNTIFNSYTTPQKSMVSTALSPLQYEIPEPLSNPARIDVCIDTAMSHLGAEVENWYLELALGDSEAIEATRDDVKTIYERVSSSISDMIAQTPHLHPKTREAALQKLRSIDLRVAEPLPLDPEMTVVKHSLSKIHHFENVLMLRSEETKRHQALIMDPHELAKCSWRMPVWGVNAYYVPMENSMTVLAGILNPPFYYKNYNDASRMGGLGMIIGHELAHAFDSTGAMFDSQGVLRDWWSDDDLHAYDKRVDCFIADYERNPTALGNWLDGTSTVNENMADTLGLRAAWHAALNKFTDSSDKREFLEAYAQLWCMSLNSETEEAIILAGDPHSVPNARVNRPIYSLGSGKIVEEVYGCKVSAEIESNCKVW
jgi:predicted metalloendopeptidase